MMLYIDSGVHAFHTMYQRLKQPVHYIVGRIYLARLFTRKIAPFGGISIIIKNEKGEPEEYAAVLFEYIKVSKAEDVYNNIKKKEIVPNE